MNAISPINEFDFPVEMKDLSVIDGPYHYPVPSNIARAVVRTDTNDILGVHKSKYKIIKHDDVVNSIADAVRDANISTDYEMSVKVFENGAKMRGFVNFPDLTVEPEVGDIAHFRIPFYNSYDGSWSFSQSAEALRLVCKNGMCDPLFIARTIAKHTTNVSVEGSSAKITAGLESFFAKEDVWKHWMTVTVGNIDAENFFKHKICAIKNNTSEFKYNFKQLDNLMGIWRDESRSLGMNKWALYNALTYWLTHTQSESATPHQTTRLREAIVAKAISNVHWEKY